MVSYGISHEKLFPSKPSKIPISTRSRTLVVSDLGIAKLLRFDRAIQNGDVRTS